MNWRIVDMSREPRRDQFAYFQTLANPYVAAASAVAGYIVDPATLD